MTDDDNLTFTGLIEDGNSYKMRDDMGNIFVLMHNTTVACGNKVCREGYTCVKTASGKKTCILADKRCCQDRYLVTGPYGVSSDRVTFSSVRGYCGECVLYMLDFGGAWVAGTEDTNQWVQVMFESVKHIRGVVTQGCKEYERWVSSYHITYKVTGDALVYVKDKSGNITIFPGNTDGFTKVINYFTKHVTARGIQIRPQTWSGTTIEMRFDFLGC